MSATVALGRTMLLIRRVLLVWWVALAVGWAVAAVAGLRRTRSCSPKRRIGHTAEVLALLAKGTDVNAKDKNGAPARRRDRSFIVIAVQVFGLTGAEAANWAAIPNGDPRLTQGEQR
jgi:hypothetical protein